MQAQTEKRKTRTARELIEVMFRHKKKAMAFFLGVAAASLVVLAFQPASYTSVSKLIIRQGRENVFMDPTLAIGETLPIHKSWESEINSELEILGSREITTEVIRHLGPEIFLHPAKPDDSGTLAPVSTLLDPARTYVQQLMEPGENEPEAQKPENEKALEALEKGLEIEALPKSDIIRISFTAQDPELANRTLRELINIYLEKRIQLHRVPGALEFFSRQTGLSLQELAENEEKIRSLAGEADVSALEDERRMLQTTIETLRSDQLRVQAGLAAARARTETLRNALSPAGSERKANGNSVLLDPDEYKEVQAELRLEEAGLAALTAENRELEGQLGTLKKELAEINALQVPIRRLLREQALLEDKYRKYAENKEQARIDKELETKAFSNVSVVQHATLPLEADPSGRMMKFAAALFIGLLGATGIAFGADAIDPTLHGAADIRSQMDLHVMAEIPRLPQIDLNPQTHAGKNRERRGTHLWPGTKELQQEAEEAFQELCFRFLADKPAHHSGALVIGITGSSGGEGVSTLACKLAAAFSQDNRFADILLLDANHGIHSEKVLKERSKLPFECRSLTEINDSKKTDSMTAFNRMLEKARRENHDVIIIDIPPLSEGIHAVQTAAAADLTGLAADCGHTPWRSVGRAAELLNNAGAKVCGVILNRQHYTMPKWLYRKL